MTSEAANPLIPCPSWCAVKHEWASSRAGAETVHEGADREVQSVTGEALGVFLSAVVEVSLAGVEQHQALVTFWDGRQVTPEQARALGAALTAAADEAERR